MQGGGEGETDQVAGKPQIRKQMRRQDCQTHGSPTSGDCGKTGDRCMQGGGEGQEDQVAREPEIRQQLPLKRAQGLSSRRRLAAQRTQYGWPAKVHTPGNWMYAERLLRGLKPS